MVSPGTSCAAGVPKTASLGTISGRCHRSVGTDGDQPDHPLPGQLTRWGRAAAFGNGILLRQRPWPEDERLDVMRHLVDTVDANIGVFLADRPHVTVDLETVGDDLPAFWRWIGAEGDVAAALAEFGTAHDATVRSRGTPPSA